MKNKDIGALFLLAAMWGGSFLFMRIASPVLGPFLTIELRVFIAGLVLLLYGYLMKRKFAFKERWKQYMVIGALNAAIPFTLIATATLTLSASFASILNATTPLFTVLVALGWLKEKLEVRKILGILMGIVGVGILLGWSPMPLSPQILFSVSLSLLAAVSYAFAGVYVKKAFQGVDSLSLSVGQQLAAAVLLMPITITKLPTVPVTNKAIAAVVGLALVCTAIAYLLYFYLIASVGPTKTLIVTLLVPLFGTLWGVVFLRERISAGMVVGLMIILLSVFIISDMKIKLKIDARHE